MVMICAVNAHYSSYSNIYIHIWFIYMHDYTCRLYVCVYILHIGGHTNLPLCKHLIFSEDESHTSLKQHEEVMFVWSAVYSFLSSSLSLLNSVPGLIDSWTSCCRRSSWETCIWLSLLCSVYAKTAVCIVRLKFTLSERGGSKVTSVIDSSSHSSVCRSQSFITGVSAFC